MHPVLRLYEDILSNDAAVDLPACPRMLFVVHGVVTIAGRAVIDGEAEYGQDPLSLVAGKQGATVWRWELVPHGSGDGALDGPGVASRTKIAAPLEMLPHGDLLWRGDTVAFPPGGCAYLHRHQGPGIRCLIEGGIRIDTHGRSTSYGPGGAWFESGPDPVFAQAPADRPSGFVRAMILPRALTGKSSIEYLNEEDKGKPRSQQYRVLVDAPLSLAAADATPPHA
jgi:hypothetical protein